MNEIRKDIVEFSIEMFLVEFYNSVRDGWAICPSNPGDVLGYGNTFTVTMVRNDDTVRSFKEYAAEIVEEPRKTRAEILEKARAARKSNAKLETNVIN